MTTAIVVARAGSTRLPGKALLPFAGSTLVGHKVRTLRQCSKIDAVVIGSDSCEILAEGEKYGAIPILRSAFHCDESRCTANEMIRDMAERVECDTIVWAHPTNPLVSSATYDDAIGTYREGLQKGFDSLCSVWREKRHAWYAGKPLNHSPWSGKHQPAAALEPVLFQDGSVFIQPREQMRLNASFYGTKPILYVIPEKEISDIDDRSDYDRALARYDAGRCSL